MRFKWYASYRWFGVCESDWGICYSANERNESCKAAAEDVDSYFFAWCEIDRYDEDKIPLHIVKWDEKYDHIPMCGFNGVFDGTFCVDDRAKWSKYAKKRKVMAHRKSKPSKTARIGHPLDLDDQFVDDFGRWRVVMTQTLSTGEKGYLIENMDDGHDEWVTMDDINDAHAEEIEGAHYWTSSPMFSDDNVWASRKQDMRAAGEKRSAKMRKKSQYALEWEHEYDEWNETGDWWFAEVDANDCKFECRINLPEGFNGSEWDAYQWDVLYADINAVYEGPYGEPTLAQAMEACEQAVAEYVEDDRVARRRSSARRKQADGIFIDMGDYCISPSGAKFYVEEFIDPSWSGYDKTVAEAMLSNYGEIYVDEYGQPIDDEYVQDEISHAWDDDVTWARDENVWASKNSRRKSAASANDMLALRDDIIDFMRRNGLCGDTRIYCNGQAWDIDYDGTVNYVGELDPRDYFDYVREPNLLSMSFEGPMYTMINSFWEDPWLSKLYDRFEVIGNRYGVYWELGNAWNLTFYEM